MRYSGLSPGTYNFWVQASNANGEWQESIRRLAIEIVPPLLQRTWFQLLLLLLFGLLLWLASRVYHRYKYGKKLALERQKVFWARKTHEDLGAEFSSLKLRFSLLESSNRLLNNNSQVPHIRRLLTTVGSGISSITWSLDHKNDSLSKLLTYCQKHAQATFVDTPFVLEFPLPTEIPVHNIQGEAHITILHIFKEALNNIIKSSHASRVQVSTVINATEIVITIADNGRGFDPALFLNSTGNGLYNMRKRMQEIDGKCEIKTGKTGTSVSIFYPL